MIDTTLKDLLEHSLEFRYQMLDRMRSDCEYYLSSSKDKNHLWAYDEAKHIRYMKVLWNSLDEKPEWLSYEDILEYEKGFKEVLQDPNYKSGIQRPYEFLAENNNVWIETPYYTPIDKMEWGDGESIEAEKRRLYFDNCYGENYIVIDEWWDKIDPFEYPNKYDGTDVHFCIGRDSLITEYDNKYSYYVIVNSPLTPHREFGYDHKPTRKEAYNDYAMALFDLRKSFEDGLKEYDEKYGTEQEKDNGREL